MAQISISLGEELRIQPPLNDGGCVSIYTKAYLGSGEDRFVFSSDVINFHGSNAVLREFAEKLLAALTPEPATEVDNSATEVEEISTGEGATA